MLVVCVHVHVCAAAFASTVPGHSKHPNIRSVLGPCTSMTLWMVLLRAARCMD